MRLFTIHPLDETGGRRDGAEIAAADNLYEAYSLARACLVHFPFVEIVQDNERLAVLDREIYREQQAYLLRGRRGRVARPAKLPPAPAAL